mgnify:CR=1 FL=1
MSSLTAGWVLTGASAQWHNARPGKVAQTLIEGEYANPVVVLDEVDKAGGDHRYDPMGALYALLERDTASALQGRVHRRRHGRVAHPVDRDRERRERDSRADPQPDERLRDRAARRRGLAPHRARRLPRDPRGASLAVPGRSRRRRVLERLAAIPPRDMRKLLLDAFGTARLAGRDHLVPEDIDALLVVRTPRSVWDSEAPQDAASGNSRSPDAVGSERPAPTLLRTARALLRGKDSCSRRDSARSRQGRRRRPAQRAQ